MPQPPRDAYPNSPQGVTIGADDGGHRHQMVGVKGMSYSEHESQKQDCQR